MIALQFVVFVILGCITCDGAPPVELSAKNCKHGFFSSPNYGTTDVLGFFVNYPANVDMDWLIVGDGPVSLYFTDFVLTWDLILGCLDYVEIFDGTNALAPSLGKFCGLIFPPVLTSSGNALFVKFFSNFDIFVAKGFEARYIPDCADCDLTDCKSHAPNVCKNTELCGFAFYDVEYTCNGGEDIQCAVDCYHCPLGILPTCKSALDGLTGCTRTYRTPCNRIEGVGLMMEQYECDTKTIDCHTPCCCDPFKQGTKPSPQRTCEGEGVIRFEPSERPEFCPCYRPDFFGLIEIIWPYQTANP